LDVGLELAEGSLKTNITVIGALMAIFSGIADYKGYKESVPEIYRDLVYGGQMAIDAVRRVTGVNRRFITVEVHKLPLHRIRDALVTLEQLETAKDQSEDVRRAEIAKARKLLEAALKELDAADLKAVQPHVERDLRIPAEKPRDERERQLGKLLRPKGPDEEYAQQSDSRPPLGERFKSGARQHFYDRIRIVKDPRQLGTPNTKPFRKRR
jgi:hypothetical protein